MQLNMEQKKLVQAPPAGQGLIKGVAGSGKTTVALHRALFLHRHYCLTSEDRLLLVTFNKTLINYLKHLYEKIEEEFKDYYTNIFSNQEKKVEIKTIDSIMYHYYTRYAKKADKYQLLSEKNTAYSILQQSIGELKKKYPRVSLLDPRHLSFLMDEIEWIKACHYLEQEEYQGADRLGRSSYQSRDAPQKLPKNSETRQAIYELMLLYNRRLRENGYIDFVDMGIMALEEARKKVDEKYNHIIVDETQDLTRVHLELIKHLYKPGDNSSITFVVDTAQSIYPHSWLVKGRSFTTVGFDMTGKSNSLTKNYRTTTQIAQAAYSLIENDENITGDENFVPPSLMDRQGVYPVLKMFKKPGDEAVYVREEIKQLLERGYTYQDIVVIARMRKQLKLLKDILDKEEIPSAIISKTDSNFEKDAVRLLTMHAIKGLEYQAVFIIGLNQNQIPYLSYQDQEEQSIQKSNERKLLYVGMTRSKEFLYLCCSDRPSPFLQEINPQYLRLNTHSRFKVFYRVDRENYLFTEQIIDMYSSEEEVRQWMIQELMNSYGYPPELLEAECQVNNFSQVGYVDLVVNINHRDNMVPFFLIETKAPGRGLENGLEQLKSYMSNCKTCRYGVITDGNEVIVLNHKLEQIDDIPLFHPGMKASKGQVYSYYDLRRDAQLKLFKVTETGTNQNSKYQLIIEDIKEGNKPRQEYKDSDLSEFPVFHQVSAGAFNLMNEKPEDYFPLPAEWFNDNKEIFLLKVRGDSMIDAGIHENDLVVVKQTPKAQNRDIVVVAIGEEATLKRYTLMGNSVLLIPENENYEPIQVNTEQAQVLGVVLGIIKAS